MTEPPDGMEYDAEPASATQQTLDALRGLRHDVPLPILAAGVVALLGVLWVVLKAVRFIIRIGKWIALASAVVAAITYVIEQSRAPDAEEEDAG
jgi:hypothetical protein